MSGEWISVGLVCLTVLFVCILGVVLRFWYERYAPDCCREPRPGPPPRLRIMRIAARERAQFEAERRNDALELARAMAAGRRLLEQQQREAERQQREANNPYRMNIVDAIRAGFSSSSSSSSSSTSSTAGLSSSGVFDDGSGSSSSNSSANRNENNPEGH